MEVKQLDLVKQYESIKEEIDCAIAGIISQSAFIGGDALSKFEEEFANYCSTKYCIGVGNGTDALEIAIESLELAKGSEIIVPANSFIASSEAVTRQGYKVVFADVWDENYTLNVDDVRRKITNNTSAIIAVHLYGHPCDMDALSTLCNESGIKLIEDCAQAHGAKYKGATVGSIGDVATFSFYPGKNLGAYGDGGAITTNNHKVAMKARMIANHGRTGKYDHQFEGRNSRLDGLQAAILSVKLKYLDSWTARRISIANRYIAELSNLDIVVPQRKEWAVQVYHLFVIRTEKRDELKEFLAKSEIYCGIHYPTALPKLNAYKYLEQIDQNPFSCASDRTLLSLPIGEHIDDDMCEFVINKVKEFFS